MCVSFCLSEQLKTVWSATAVGAAPVVVGVDGTGVSRACVVKRDDSRVFQLVVRGLEL